MYRLRCEWKRDHALRDDDGGRGPAAEADERDLYYSRIGSTWVRGGKGLAVGDRGSKCIGYRYLESIEECLTVDAIVEGAACTFSM